MEVSTDRTKEDAIDLGEAEGPIVRLVNLMISTGINEGASDIHVEPSKKAIKNSLSLFRSPQTTDSNTRYCSSVSA